LTTFEVSSILAAYTMVKKMSGAKIQVKQKQICGTGCGSDSR